MPRPTNLFGNTPEQLVATFRGALLPHPAPTQPTRTTPSTGKKRFNTHRHRLAQFNEFYRQCPPPPFQCLHSFALVGTPDRMLFIIVRRYGSAAAAPGERRTLTTIQS